MCDVASFLANMRLSLTDRRTEGVNHLIGWLFNSVRHPLNVTRLNRRLLVFVERAQIMACLRGDLQLPLPTSHISAMVEFLFRLVALAASEPVEVYKELYS